jgi:putative tryptophan/tyrosine transport system substrate-binding protein
MANIDYPAVVLEMREFQAAAGTLGLEVATLEIRRGEDIAPAFEALKGRADALYVCADPLVVTHQVRINTLALAARLPTMHGLREHVETGGLMSYGPNFPDLFRRVDYVDKILRGTKPGDIPVEQPTKFDLIINLTTAKALGLAIPEFPSSNLPPDFGERPPHCLKKKATCGKLGTTTRCAARARESV